MATDREKHLQKLRDHRAGVEGIEQDLLDARERRNVAIYHACEGGVTEREAAEVVGVSNGYVGRCHRTGGVPDKERKK